MKKNLLQLIVSVLSLLLFSCDLISGLMEEDDNSSASNYVPLFSIESGTYASSFLVELSSETTDVLIFYTLDGTNPTQDSELYTGPFYINESCTVKAITIKEGRSNSSVISKSYTLDTTNQPIISPPGGRYSYNKTVTITSNEEDAVIRYTTDGSEPNIDSRIYNREIRVGYDTTIKARYFIDDEEVGETSTADYTFQAAPVIFSVTEESVESEQRLYLSCNTSGTTIYYTLDGSIPGTWSYQYYTPTYYGGTKIQINRDMTVKAIAVKDGWISSSITQKDYRMQLPEITVNNNAGRYTGGISVTLNAGVSGALIFYTLDGTEPDETSILYTDAISLGSSTTLKAVSIKDGWHSSPTLYNYYEIPEVTILAGSGYPGWYDGQGREANLRGPAGMALSSDGNILFADSENNRICLLTPDGTVSTYTGKRTAGGTNGSLEEATFNGPSGITIDGEGNVYITETDANRIRKIDTEGIVSTIAGSGTAGLLDGEGLNARFWQPRDIVINSEGIIYVADTRNSRLRKISPEGQVTTLGVDPTIDFGEENNGTLFNNAKALAVDSDDNIYLSASYGIYKITPEDTVELLKELTDTRAQVNDIVCGPNNEVYVLNVSTFGSYYSGYHSYISELISDGNYKTVINSTPGNGDTESIADTIEIRPQSFLLLDNSGCFYTSDSLVSQNGYYRNDINVIRKFYWQDNEL